MGSPSMASTTWAPPSPAPNTSTRVAAERGLRVALLRTRAAMRDAAMSTRATKPAMTAVLAGTRTWAWLMPIRTTRDTTAVVSAVQVASAMASSKLPRRQRPR